MPANEPLRVTEYSILEIELSLLIVDAKLSLIKEVVQLLEDAGNQVRILVPEVPQAQVSLSEVVRAEKLVGAKAELEVINQFLHPHALIQL